MAANTINLAIAGVGNCASALLQGLRYYASTDDTTGLIVADVGGYAVTDIVPVAAFDINKAKVEEISAEAIFAAPNNAYRLPGIQVPPSGVTVQMTDPLDGAPEHWPASSTWQIRSRWTCACAQRGRRGRRLEPPSDRLGTSSGGCSRRPQSTLGPPSSMGCQN